MNYFKIYLTPQGIQIQDQEGKCVQAKEANWDLCINQKNLFEVCKSEMRSSDQDIS